jgi:hypothetical protein
MGFVGHFVLPLRTFSRVFMATTVLFSLRAIEDLSIFDSSNAKSCASSGGVHGRPLGRGPSFISLSLSARCCAKSSCDGKFHPFNRISLTVQEGRRFNEAIAQDPSMFEAITAFLIVLSVGILIAHALDAFRHWS